MITYEIYEEKGTKYEIQLYAVRCGKDLSVTICGGSGHHVGAVALASGILPDGSRPKYSATVNMLSVLDHKDYVLAQEMAAYLADRLGCQVSMTVGIHIDDAAKEEIHILHENTKNICQKLLLKFQK